MPCKIVKKVEQTQNKNVKKRTIEKPKKPKVVKNEHKFNYI